MENKRKANYLNSSVLLDEAMLELMTTLEPYQVRAARSDEGRHETMAVSAESKIDNIESYDGVAKIVRACVAEMVKLLGPSTGREIVFVIPDLPDDVESPQSGILCGRSHSKKTGISMRVMGYRTLSGDATVVRFTIVFFTLPLPRVVNEILTPEEWSLMSTTREPARPAIELNQ